MRKNMTHPWLVGIACILCGVAAGAEPANKVILGNDTLWRVRAVWEPEEILLESGKIGHFRLTFGRRAFSKSKENILKDFKVEKVPLLRLPRETSPDWMKTEFDDAGWLRARGPMFNSLGWQDDLVGWKLLWLRGRFEVTDPAKAGDMTLSITYRGGVVVYLNGEEVARQHMPAGKSDMYAAAEPYPIEAWMTPKGTRGRAFERRHPERAKLRTRKLEGFKIPAAKLRKGVNVLAVAVHRAATRWQFHVTRGLPYGDFRRMSLYDMTLSAKPDAAVVPEGSWSAAGAGKLHVWNQSILRRVYVNDYPSRFETLRPVRMAGTRNGTFVEQLVASCNKPIKGLKVEVSDLSGPGQIPASAVRVYYALSDGASEGKRRRDIKPFSTMEEFPPAEVPVFEGGGAIQPIYVRIHVPRDAKPGDYKATIRISADGLEPVETPLELRVYDYALPDPKDFTVRTDIAQSPESLSMAYNVPMWSEKHWKLIERSFSLMAPLATKTIWITCIRRTHFGNEHAMVRWVRGKDGEIEPDLSIVERYLNTAVKHLGKVPGVILYAWEPPSSEGHVTTNWGARTHDRDLLITTVSQRTGRLRKSKGPNWGSPESRTFWKKLVVGMRALLTKHDMADSMMFGLLGDHRATKLAMDDMCGEDKSIKWALHSHAYAAKWQGYDIGMCGAACYIRCRPGDPKKGHGYGWKLPFWMMRIPRPSLQMKDPLGDFHNWAELWIAALPAHPRWPGSKGAQGLARMGADFYNVLKDSSRSRRSKWGSAILGRYPESNWGQLNMQRTAKHLLGRGRDGAVPSAISEALRTNIQECEARIFIEKALEDEAKKAKLGDGLAKRCRDLLDERIRICNRATGNIGGGTDAPGWTWFVGSGWKKRTAELYSLAAEVTKKLDAK